MNIAFFLAAALAVFWTLVHVIIGGRQCERLLAADEHVSPVVRETMLLCWHMVSGFLFLTSAFLFIGAIGYPSFGVAGSVMAGVTALIGLLQAPIRKTSYAALPQGWLFVPVAVLGIWGFMG
ncbi:hypothetical protein Q8W37_12060 [Shimia thalassica]|uniref:hypothetical protein n=1 Tax=Shimia thalassica TaxID=1715693 RepID=UPI000C06D66D|nr:hypothetical protein [Shimia thalassica]PHO02576.1 hypothetical protein CSC82_18780 [Rhodobacteraceae bacterium 4F10]MBU2944265.1 hypothetical protein [Shimia thalassica]MDO6479879.1 hypothetical protein [Shimia thalassica]MDO6483138.1 hypothetical protein [Shimia thalassica]MDO6504951.1 hypothetical protein [Shimia thalassica]